MHSIALRILCEEEDCSNANQVRILRRSLRDHSNPLELYEPIFIQNYRVNKDMFRLLLNVLTNSLPPSKTSFGIPPVVKLSYCLRFFAEGGYQRGVGKDCEVGLAQSSFSIVLSEVLNILESVLCPQWITWLTTDEKRKYALPFYEKFKIPGVVGAVDRTHVGIIAPPTNKHLFYNRKGSYSLNVMLVCDGDMRIRFIDATHPGASHDSLIWNTSELRAEMERDFLQSNNNYWLLGDAGYALEPWLLTPYRAPKERSIEERYNELHSKCRNVIERVNGVLKNRWRCLLESRQLHYSPLKAVKITNVCAALHNMCIHFKLPTEDNVLTPDKNSSRNINEEEPTDMSSSYLIEAQRIRNNVASSL